jgi:hypothetical protein
MKICNSFLSSIASAILIPTLISLPVFAESGEPASATAVQLLVHARVQGGAISVQVTDESNGPIADAAVVVRLPDSGETGTFADGTHAAVAYTDARGEAHVPGLTWSDGTGTVPVKITATKGTARAGMLLEEQLGKTPAEPVARKAEPVTPVPAPTKSAPEPGQVKMASAVPAGIAPLPPAAAVPMVTITHGPTNEKISGGSHKKWIILAVVVGAGAGVAFALASKKSSSSSSTSTSTTTIGAPTVSVGAP